jgi:hypothetical protein
MIARRRALPTRAVLATTSLLSCLGSFTACAASGAEATGASRSEIVSGAPVAAGYFVKINQAMSNGARLLCSGAFLTPHVVLTAAHCTRNYDYGDPITPTVETEIRYGEDFGQSQPIAGDETVGWKELGSTDIGLYRVAQPVAVAFPRVFRSCETLDLVGKKVVVSGRMAGEDRDGAADQFFSSPEVTISRVQNGVGANGNYLVLGAAASHGGDSGGPWVLDDQVVGATHTGNTGARFCDVAEEVRQQVEAWGDTLRFVEDGDGAGGAGGNGGSANGGSGGAISGAGGASAAGSANGGSTSGTSGTGGGLGVGMGGVAPAGNAGVSGNGAQAGSMGNAMAGSAGGGATSLGAPSADTASDASGSSCTATGRTGNRSAAWSSLICWLALVASRRRRGARAKLAPPRPATLRAAPR